MGKLKKEKNALLENKPTGCVSKMSTFKQDFIKIVIKQLLSCNWSSGSLLRIIPLEHQTFNQTQRSNISSAKTNTQESAFFGIL